MKNPRWKGIFPTITTKLHADESLDLEGTCAARGCRWSAPNASLSRLS